MQTDVPESDGPQLGNEAEAEARDVRRDKTEASQSAGLSRTTESERSRYSGIAAGATAGKPQEHQAVQSAVPDFDGLKLGNEVKAEIHDVRRDRTKVNQSVSLSGIMEVEHQAAGQVAGSQTLPKSRVPAVAGLDAGWAVKTAKKKAALTGVKAAGPSGTVEIERLNCAADQAAGIQARPRSPPRHRGSTAGATAEKLGEHQATGQVVGSQTRPRSPVPKRWANLSDDATDVDSTSTEHLNLDQEAAEQELLEKMLETMPRVPRRVLEMLRAEPGQKSWTELVTACRAEGGTARGELSPDKQWTGSARQRRSQGLH